MRILVLGNSGSGKSTFARQLGEVTGNEVIHLDAYFWQPGWIPTPQDQWQQIVETLVKKPSWIMDGNYLSTFTTRIKRADTVIFLDRPRLTCYWRILKRFFICKFSNRPDIGPGCPEKIDWEFIRWIWNFPNQVKPQLISKIQLKTAEKSLCYLSSQADISRFLQRMTVQAGSD